jgi:acyl-coenzyme A thioesterase PaaI-like protein
VRKGRRRLKRWAASRAPWDTIIAEAWIERAGKSTCFAEGRLLNAASEVLAKGTSTIRLIPRAKVEADARAAAE